MVHFRLLIKCWTIPIRVTTKVWCAYGKMTTIGAPSITRIVNSLNDTNVREPLFQMTFGRENVEALYQQIMARTGYGRNVVPESELLRYLSPAYDEVFLGSGNHHGQDLRPNETKLRIINAKALRNIQLRLQAYGGEMARYQDTLDNTHARTYNDRGVRQPHKPARMFVNTRHA